jgi:cytidylate kinase
VGARLGWAVYDHELLERIAQEMGLRAKLLESVDERHVSWLQECLEAFASSSRVSSSAYVKHLIETMLALSTHGGCVIVGRGAAQILPSATTLRVRLVAPLENRIRVMSQELGVSRTEAARRVEEIDRQRKRFIQEHFLHDPTDLQHYDLLLNTARFTVEECAALIVEALHGFQARAEGRGSGAAQVEEQTAGSAGA